MLAASDMVFLTAPLTREIYGIVGERELKLMKEDAIFVNLARGELVNEETYPRRAGTGMTDKELKRLVGILKPLHVPKMPLSAPPPRDSRFGSPLKLSSVHWVRPEIVVEVTYLTWTKDNLLRQVSYQGQREDKSACQVVRSSPIPPRPR
jgi:ATP-dependent DNA ligase